MVFTAVKNCNILHRRVIFPIGTHPDHPDTPVGGYSYSSDIGTVAIDEKPVVILLEDASSSSSSSYDDKPVVIYPIGTQPKHPDIPVGGYSYSSDIETVAIDEKPVVILLDDASSSYDNKPVVIYPIGTHPEHPDTPVGGYSYSSDIGTVAIDEKPVVILLDDASSFSF